MHIFDSKINLENLTKCLQTLKHMYEDHMIEKVNICKFKFLSFSNLFGCKMILFSSLSVLQSSSLSVNKHIQYNQIKSTFLFFQIEWSMSKWSWIPVLPNSFELKWWCHIKVWYYTFSLRLFLRLLFFASKPTADYITWLIHQSHKIKKPYVWSLGSTWRQEPWLRALIESLERVGWL